MPMPIMDPVEKTAQEIRRSIGRLELYRSNNQGNDLVVAGTISEILRDLGAAYSKIPDGLKKEG